MCVSILPIFVSDLHLCTMVRLEDSVGSSGTRVVNYPVDVGNWTWFSGRTLICLAIFSSSSSFSLPPFLLSPPSSLLFSPTSPPRLVMVCAIELAQQVKGSCYQAWWPGTHVMEEMDSSYKLSSDFHSCYGRCVPHPLTPTQINALKIKLKVMTSVW